MGHDNPLQYSCLENPLDRGAWQAVVHRVMKNRPQWKRLRTAQHYRVVQGCVCECVCVCVRVCVRVCVVAAVAEDR